MCASANDSSSSGVRRQVIAWLREQLGAANIPDHRLVSDDDLYKVFYTAWWLTLVDGRNPDDQNELAATLRMMRLLDNDEVAA